MKNLRKYFIIVFLLLICLAVFVFLIFTLTKRKPEDKIQTELSLVMNEVRKNHHRSQIPVYMVKKYGTLLIPYLQTYISDSNSFVRLEAKMNMLSIATDSNSTSARQEIVYSLLKQIQNENDGLNRQDVASRLQGFVSADFTVESKEILKKLLLRDIEGKLGNLDDIERYIFLIVGIADMKSELPVLKEYIDKTMDSFNKAIKEKQRWDAHNTFMAIRASARMGDKEGIKRCIDLVESVQNENDKIALVRELSYVRQPEVVEYLYSYLKMDKTPPSLGPDVLMGSYADYAMEGLKLMLKDFPVRGYEPNAVDKCRKWMAEQKEWKIIR